MPPLVTSGALLMCTFGAAPSTLTVIPHTVNGSKMAAGTIMDFKPMANIMPFGMCSAPSNPQVASATAAASGVLTPQPCIPNVVSPWTPGSPTVKIAKMAALNPTCTNKCLWAGVITITNPGQTTVNVA